MLVEGTAARDGIGNALDNVITGNAAHNGLVGGDGNDTLIGGLSDDAMFGGFGNDTYSVDNASDLVGEPFGGGFDTVHSSLPAYVLADTLEGLVLDPGATWAIGNASDNTLTGNGISNYLIGYGGNDSLTGVGGDASNDTMIGGLGDDTYHLDSAGDEAIENAGEGSDLIISEAPSYTLPSNIEAMFLGGAGVWGFGNESDNTLAGSKLTNFLFGRGGNDYLNGGGGQAARSRPRRCFRRLLRRARRAPRPRSPARRSRRAPGSWRRCCCSSTSWLSLSWGRRDERRPTRLRVTGFHAPICELAHISGYMRLASAASSAVFSISSPTSSTEAPASMRLRMSCRRVSCWTICGTWSRFSMKRQT